MDDMDHPRSLIRASSKKGTLEDLELGLHMQNPHPQPSRPEAYFAEENSDELGLPVHGVTFNNRMIKEHSTCTGSQACLPVFQLGVGNGYGGEWIHTA